MGLRFFKNLRLVLGYFTALYHIDFKLISLKKTFKSLQKLGIKYEVLKHSV